MPDEPKRKRYVGRDWPRKDGGEYLPRPPPTGKRPPSGVIWASSVDRFYHIQRIPNIELITCWSLSMIKEWNQTSHEEEEDNDEIEPEPDPQPLWPYPFLTVPVEVYQPDAFPRDDAARANPFGKSFGTEDKLEEFIPDAFFPDVLVVNDPTGITEGRKVTSNGYEHAESSPIKYKRLWPILERTEAESSVETGDKSEVCDVDEAKVDEGAEEPGDEGDTDKSKDNSSEEHRESDKEGGRPDKVAEDADEMEEVYWHWCKYSTAEENAPPKTRHSPILLVEDCGVPIEPKRMNIDDR
ncbi:hypothetical protein EYR36_002225 [Pleurotus pulmonarius]|nr:hypothetical protein EYR36_002225 [Pleurotus pulmonarius]